MNALIAPKPEPVAAKPNWHYDSYFLLQLERLNTGKSVQTNNSLIADRPVEEIAEIEANALENDSQPTEMESAERDRVINRINELASSIGICVTIIENADGRNVDSSDY